MRPYPCTYRRFNKSSFRLFEHCTPQQIISAQRKDSMSNSVRICLNDILILTLIKMDVKIRSVVSSVIWRKLFLSLPVMAKLETEKRKVAKIQSLVYTEPLHFHISFLHIYALIFFIFGLHLPSTVHWMVVKLFSKSDPFPLSNNDLLQECVLLSNIFALSFEMCLRWPALSHLRCFLVWPLTALWRLTLMWVTQTTQARAARSIRLANRCHTCRWRWDHSKVLGCRNWGRNWGARQKGDAFNFLYHFLLQV